MSLLILLILLILIFINFRSVILWFCHITISIFEAFYFEMFSLLKDYKNVCNKYVKQNFHISKLSISLLPLILSLTLLLHSLPPSFSFHLPPFSALFSLFPFPLPLSLPLSFSSSLPSFLSPLLFHPFLLVHSSLSSLILILWKEIPITLYR